MKVLILFSSLVVLSNFFACDNIVDNNNNLIIRNSKGTIVKDSLRSPFHFIKLDQDYLGTSNLFPSNLPDSFKYEGKRILFSGKFISCPPDANCIRYAITLLYIRDL